jgi:superfamily II DNA/RNA helicase
VISKTGLDFIIIQTKVVRLKILDGKTLIFANKKSDVKEIASRVDEYGYGIVCLNGDIDQEERKYSLEQIIKKKFIINIIIII